MGLLNRFKKAKGRSIEMRLLHPNEVLGVEFCAKIEKNVKGPLKIMDIGKGSAAERAGLEVGMSITSVGGMVVETKEDVYNAVMTIRSAEKTSFKITVLEVAGKRLRRSNDSNSYDASSEEVLSDNNDGEFPAEMSKPLLGSYADDLLEGPSSASMTVTCSIPEGDRLGAEIANFSVPRRSKRGGVRKQKIVMITHVDQNGPCKELVPGRVLCIDKKHHVEDHQDVCQVIGSLKLMGRTQFSITIVPTPNFMLSKRQGYEGPRTEAYVPPAVSF
eukprot:TRINITY_DN4961_c0_g1_i1.p1 TRINITY_DN4961_c0_g1~~TRINITY_DN4961_c0_g1_i1.p1  ORF type:complete len:274 (+),score=53.12 TRINITY_DN4961_c0_g1_i1:59-880(+)